MTIKQNKSRSTACSVEDLSLYRCGSLTLDETSALFICHGNMLKIDIV